MNAKPANYLSAVADIMEQVIALDSGKSPQQLARTAAQLIRAGRVSKAAAVLTKLARQLDDRFATTGYLLSAVLGSVASCKYLLRDPDVAEALENASAKLRRRIDQLQGIAGEALAGSSRAIPRSRKK